MRVETAAIELETPFEHGMVDITARVAAVMRERGVRDGLLTLVPESSSNGILLVDGAPDIVRGVGELIERAGEVRAEGSDLALEAARPAFEALLAGVSRTLPVAGGHLAVGHSRKVFLLECEGPGFRRILVHIVATSAIDHTVLETPSGVTIDAGDEL